MNQPTKRQPTNQPTKQTNIIQPSNQPVDTGGNITFSAEVLQ